MSVCVFKNGACSDQNYIAENYTYITDPLKTDNGKLIGAVNCSVKHAVKDMMTVKKVNHKTHGKQAFNMVISITPDLSSVSDDDYMQIASRVVGRFTKNQAFYAVHKDSKYRHIHITINSVSFENGLKYSQSKKELNNIKVYINHLLDKYGLDLINTSVDDIIDTSPYNLEDGFDFLEIYDDKPEPRVPIIVDADDDEFFCNNDNRKFAVDLVSAMKKNSYEAENNEKMEENKMKTFKTNDSNIISIQEPTTEYYQPQLYSGFVQPQNTWAYQNIQQYPQNQAMNNWNNNTYLCPQNAANDCSQVLAIPSAQTPALPALRLNFNKILNLNVPNTVDSNLLNDYLSQLEANPQTLIDRTKLGMAVMNKFQQQGIQGDVVIDMETIINVNLPNDKDNNYVDVSFEEEK